MRTKKKRKVVNSKPSTQDALDVQIRELSEQIDRLQLSSQDELEEILRLWKKGECAE